MTDDYLVLPKTRITEGDLSLRAVQVSDIELIRQWRNSQMDVLRQDTPISRAAQQKYFEENVWPGKESKKPGQILLIIENKGKPIGYGGLVHISWPYGRAEISFLLKPSLEQDKKTLKKIFYDYIKIIQMIAFQDLKLYRLTTETFEQRTLHINTLEQAGFKLEGRLRDHVVVSGKRLDALVHGCLKSDWRQRFTNVGSEAILVTSASRKVPLISAIKKAVSQLARSVRVIAGDIDPLAIARHESDEFWQMPVLRDENLNGIIDGCRARKIRIVLPTRDGELEYWSKHQREFESAGIDVIISEFDSVVRCRDKLAFSIYGASIGLPVIPAALNPQSLGIGPLVVKERFGSASIGIGVNLNLKQAIEHASNLENPIFQPFINGKEISIDAWVDTQGRVVGVVLRHRDSVVAGESQITTTMTNPKLEREAHRVVAGLKLRGPVVIQAIVIDDVMHVIECNPRFGGASTASIAVGLESLLWSMQESFDRTKAIEFKRSVNQIRQIRMAVDRIINDFDFRS